MATKVFSKALMASEDVKSYLGSTRFYSSDVETAIFDGAIVKLGALLDSDVYTGIKDYNVQSSTVPDLVTDSIALVDLAEIGTVSGQGVKFYFGNKLTDLVSIPGGSPARIRIPQVGDKYWIGIGNFDSAPTVGQFAGTKAESSLHAASETLPVSGYAVEILAEQPLTIGQSVASGDKIYLVQVKRV